MAAQLHRLTVAFAAAFALVALASGYWGLVSSDALVSRPDNPRRVLLERRVPRGAIFDRNGALLAESVGEPGALERRYPYPALGPVLGYASPFYGAAGLEEAYDPLLHGDLGYAPLELYWQGSVLGAPPPGRDLRLTLDLNLQAAADEALGGQTGAVVLVQSETGEILALASHPGFDPNQLDEQWPTLVSDEAAPLLNRTTLALYQPGGAVWPVVLAGAFQSGYGDASLPFPMATTPVVIGDQDAGCRREPTAESLTLAQALQFGCPWPVAVLGNRVGVNGLGELFDTFGLYTAPDIGLPAIAAERAPETDARLAAVGQGKLTLTPLHLALVTAGLAEKGQVPAPRLVDAIEGRDGQWVTQPAASHAVAAVAPESANRVKGLIAAGYSATALTGAEGQSLAWFAGFAPTDDSKYAVAVLLENGDEAAAADIGRRLLQTALGR